MMMKTLEAINEAVRNPKHPFRKTDDHPKKAVKHRYERRKIREYLQLTDWLSEEAIEVNFRQLEKKTPPQGWRFLF
jgi:hypothetical protein